MIETLWLLTVVAAVVVVIWWRTDYVPKARRRKSLLRFLQRSIECNAHSYVTGLYSGVGYATQVFYEGSPTHDHSALCERALRHALGVFDSARPHPFNTVAGDLRIGMRSEGGTLHWVVPPKFLVATCDGARATYLYLRFYVEPT